jgi:(2Fe-2S) ferredoxin
MLDGQPPQAILDLVGSVRELGQRAALQYRPVVDDIVRSGCRHAQHIERTLDGLLDFCGHEPVVLMYRELCRHYWQIDPAATAFYVDAYRERWDSEEQGGQA